MGWSRKVVDTYELVRGLVLFVIFILFFIWNDARK
jgi:hypothetical protein